MKKIIGFILIGCLLISSIGCAKNDSSDNSIINQSDKKTEQQENDNKQNDNKQNDNKQKSDIKVADVDLLKKEYANFAFELFGNCISDENVMISPLSIMTALAMTANGADNNTLSQMENVLCSGDDLSILNQNIAGFGNQLISNENAKLNQANAIWCNKEKFDVDKAFLDLVTSNYNAEIYNEQFSDKTLGDINGWVSNNTDKMIENILDKVDPDAVMYLVNAVAFDAKWQDEYEENQVDDAEFTNADETVSNVSMMYSEEGQYLHDENTVGLIKPYKEGYSFVALLPDENMDLSEYEKTLTAKKWQNLVDNISYEVVETAIPKFSSAYSNELSNPLIQMGMKDAFSPEDADFGKMGSTKSGENVCISRVLHKTFVSVDEQGTKAGAATVVVMDECGASMEEDPPKVVYLNRPFIYAIVDNETMLPVFIGEIEKLK